MTIPPPPPPGGDPTRRLDPTDGADVTRRVEPDASRRAGGGYDERRAPLEAEVPLRHSDPARPAAEHPTYDRDRRFDAPVDEDDPPGHGRARTVALFLGGAVLGFLLAFVVVALTTGGDQGVGEQEAATAALEAELAERDASISELQSQLAEAEAAAGDRAEDIEAQRSALEERSQDLDDRAAALDDRERALDEREAQLREREQAVDDGVPGDAPPGQEGDGGGLELPSIDVDTTEVEGFVERLLDGIRDLFGN